MPGIPRDLQQRVGIGEGVLEVIGGGTEGFGPCTEQSASDVAGLVDPPQGQFA